MQERPTGDGQPASNAVAIEHVDGQWAVQITEDGTVKQRTFETLEYARNFAEGQKSRRGLATISSAKSQG